MGILGTRGTRVVDPKLRMTGSGSVPHDKQNLHTVSDPLDPTYKIKSLSYCLIVEKIWNISNILTFSIMIYTCYFLMLMMISYFRDPVIRIRAFSKKYPDPQLLLVP